MITLALNLYGMSNASSIILGLGIALLCLGLVLIFREFGNVLGVVFIGIGLGIMFRVIALNSYDVTTDLTGKDDPVGQMQEQVSMDLGMQLINFNENTYEKVSNNKSATLYAKDKDCVYACNVVYNNETPRYYYESNGNTIELKNYGNNNIIDSENSNNNSKESNEEINSLN